jgi:hypothetical protein
MREREPGTGSLEEGTRVRGLFRSKKPGSSGGCETKLRNNTQGNHHDTAKLAIRTKSNYITPTEYCTY